MAGGEATASYNRELYSALSASQSLEALAYEEYSLATNSGASSTPGQSLPSGSRDSRSPDADLDLSTTRRRPPGSMPRRDRRERQRAAGIRGSEASESTSVESGPGDVEERVRELIRQSRQMFEGLKSEVGGMLDEKMEMSKVTDRGGKLCVMELRSLWQSTCMILNHARVRCTRRSWTR